MGHPAGTPLQTALRTPEFWRCYAMDEADGFDLAEEGERLAEVAGEPNVDLPIRPGWFLRLNLYFEVHVHTLHLCDVEDPDDLDENDNGDIIVDSELELGHWDQARWHPYCLHWEELEAVVRFMRAAEGDRRRPGAARPFRRR